MSAPVEVQALLGALVEFRDAKPAGDELSVALFDQWFSLLNEESEDDDDIAIAVDAVPLQLDVASTRERTDEAQPATFDVASIDVTTFIGRERIHHTPAAAEAPKTASVPAWMQATIAQAQSTSDGRGLEVLVAHPVHGEVSIHVLREDGALTVKITAPSDASLSELRSELGDLHAGFAAAGLRLKSILLAVRPNKRARKSKDSQ